MCSLFLFIHVVQVRELILVIIIYQFLIIQLVQISLLGDGLATVPLLTERKDAVLVK